MATFDDLSGFGKRNLGQGNGAMRPEEAAVGRARGILWAQKGRQKSLPAFGVYEMVISETLAQTALAEEGPGSEVMRLAIV